MIITTLQRSAIKFLDNSRLSLCPLSLYYTLQTNYFQEYNIDFLYIRLYT